MKTTDKIFVAGHTGMTGSAMVRALRARGFENLALRTHSQLDLTNQSETEDFFDSERPDIAVITAARVGGIYANMTYPAEFIEENLAIALNTIRAAKNAGTKRLLYMGSTCIYPRSAPQPLKEDSLLCGSLEKSNEAYAVAKLSGIKICEFFRRQYGLCYHSVLPTNLYGPGDNYRREISHVMPALIRRFHEAAAEGKDEVVLWGTGNPLREFLHVDDFASACLLLLEIDNPPDFVNLGSGEEVSIRELSKVLAEATGFKGKITFDQRNIDGLPRKLCDISFFRSLGWKPKYDIKSGVKAAYESFKRELKNGTARL